MTITLTREEAQSVLDALETMSKDVSDVTLPERLAIETLRARLSASEQLGEIVPADEEQLKRIAKLVQPEPSVEPVAWLHSFTGGGWRVVPEKEYPTDRPLYLAPPQRNWQGLTDEEIKSEWLDALSIKGETFLPYIHFARVIEQILREKNA